MDYKKTLLFALVVPNVLWLGMQGILPGIESQNTRTIWAINAGTIYYSAFFFYGAVLAKHKNDIITKIKRYKRGTKGILFVVSMTLISFRWTFYGLLSPLTTSQNKYLVTIWEDVMIALGIVLLLALVLSSKSIHSFLTTKAMLWLGKVSYSLYLVHVLVIMFCGKVLSHYMPLKIAIPMAILLTLPLAGLTYEWIEAPCMAMGKKLANKMISLKG